MNKREVSKKQNNIKKAVILYHLQQIKTYAEKIQKSMFILKNFSENENEIREAIALRAADNSLPKISKTHEADRKFLRLMEAFEDENKKIEREMVRLRSKLKRDCKLLFLVKNAVIQLKEPEKSVIMMRYFKKMPWKEIYKKTEKSKSYTFQIHALGIKNLSDLFSAEQINFLQQMYLMNTEGSLIYSNKNTETSHNSMNFQIE